MKFLKSAFNLERLIGLALLAGFLVVYWLNPYPIDFVRNKSFDFYQVLKPRPIPEPGTSPVIIIDLDEESLNEIGQWPWPRNILAEMTRNLFVMGVGVLGFDIVFAEPDRMNPSVVAESLAGLDEETKSKILTLSGNDEAFAKILRKGRVVLGQAAYWEKLDTAKGPPVKKSVTVRKVSKNAPDPQMVLPNVPSLVRNIPILEKSTAHKKGGHGIFSLVPEKDGIVRRYPTAFVYEKELYPSFAVEMLRVAAGKKSTVVTMGPLGVKQYAVSKRFKFPTDKIGRVYPYFSKQDRSKYVSARDVLNGTADPNMIKGKLALVGTSAVGLLDIRAIPTEGIIPGVEVHAQVLENAIQKNFLVRPNYADAVELFLILVGGLLMIILVPWVGAKWALVMFLVIGGGAGGTSWYMFSEYRMLFDAAFAVTSILLLYTTLTFTGYAREEANKKQTRAAFSKYLSPDMVERVAENPEELVLGGEERELTLLFCDVRGFTPISELFSPQGLTALINKLLTPLTNQIMDRNGTVDKYMGDCIMAFWNAPLDDEKHARNGCLSALAMLAEMDPLNERLEQEAKEEGRKHLDLKVGLGLNSGPAVVGNMGSDQRFDYSVLGDTVNLAARLEGQSKGYGVRIVLGPNTAEQVPELAQLELDLIKVKGKTEAVRIFALVGDEEMMESDFYKGLKPKHDRMLELYRAQKWDESCAAAKECREYAKDSPFEIDGFYELYETRNAEYKATPPVPQGEEWDGVFVATTK